MKNGLVLLLFSLLMASCANIYHSPKRTITQAEFDSATYCFGRKTIHETTDSTEVFMGVRNCQLQGKFKSFYKGVLVKKGMFKNNVPSGTWRFYIVNADGGTMCYRVTKLRNGEVVRAKLIMPPI